jgi:predicted O-methyltransferase YrrM
MDKVLWSAVDDYLTELVVRPDAALDDALARSEAAGLPPINVTPAQGKLLHLLARMQGARNILEIGTLGGYSTIWLARALPPGGRLITLEYEPKHAEVARANFAAAGLSDKIELRLGRAIETLPELEREGGRPFDLVFIDADKPSTPEYFKWSLKLTRPGGVILVDNVIRKGAVVDGATPREDSDGERENIAGIKRFLGMAGAEPRVSVTAIQTVGGKGYDGFAIALVL